MESVQAAPSSAPATRVHVRFEPSGKCVRVPAGVSVFDAASWNAIGIDSTCGGHGTCKKCRVQVLEGDLPVSPADSRAFTEEALADGWRLACLAATRSDVGVLVPPLTTRPKAATVGVGRQVILRPVVVKRLVSVVLPSLSDQRSDAERVLDEIADIAAGASPFAIRRLPGVLRTSDFTVTAVVVDDTLIDIEPGDTTSDMYAIACDLGTTTVVATLLDLTTGLPVAVASMLNRQSVFGADVISRISACARKPEVLVRLTQLAQETVEQLTADVCSEGGVDPGHVYAVSVAGNTTMTHLILGMDPTAIGSSPFIPAAREYPPVPAVEVGFAVHPQASVYFFPSLGAYVGGDIVAGALATGFDRDDRIRMFIDIGTNCEVILAAGGRLISTAAPAGPAFEAASIRCGMRAATGAIEEVRLGDSVEIGVIGGGQPTGICGSGLIDAVAELRRLGLIAASGRLADTSTPAAIHDSVRGRLQDIRGERAFLLGEMEDGSPVYLTQNDIRELQFAKGAISTAWTILAEALSIDPASIDQVLLAGSFGSYINAQNAIRIGLVPHVPVERVISAGNVASEGAKMALLSGPERHGATSLVREIAYVELSDRADFNERFVDALAFSD